MANESTSRSPYADIAPALGEYTDHVLFGEVWERPGLSKRDRSLITVTTLIEVITHLAFYAGWPSANTAVMIARQVFAETAQ